jgi:hypothetical protein
MKSFQKASEVISKKEVAVVVFTHGDHYIGHNMAIFNNLVTGIC